LLALIVRKYYQVVVVEPLIDHKNYFQSITIKRGLIRIAFVISPQFRFRTTIFIANRTQCFPANLLNTELIGRNLDSLL